MKKRKLMNLKIGHAENGVTLIEFLSDRLGVSRNKAKEIIDQRRVFINGRRVWMARHRLKSGNQITGSFSAEKSADIKNTNILYEDNDYLIVNKPAGISSNGPNSVEELLNRQSGEAPRGTCHGGTDMQSRKPRGNLLRRSSTGYAGRVFAEPCEARSARSPRPELGTKAEASERGEASERARNAIPPCGNLRRQGYGGQEPQGFLAKKGNESAAACHEPRVACHDPRVACHRLDKDTSGCLIFAKSAKAKERIIMLFVKNEITKKYEAIIRGHLPNSFRPVPLVPLVPKRQSEEKPQGDSFRSFRVKETMTIATPIDGQKAITHIRILDTTPLASHISISIETGRTHQIRKHLASIGHPVLGDQRYGVGREVPQSERLIGRQMLHAVEIKFIQPFSGLPVHARAPLPTDIRDCLKQYHLS